MKKLPRKYSDITVFSFHPVKIITTAEGSRIQFKKIDENLVFKKSRITRKKGLLKKNKLSYYEFQN